MSRSPLYLANAAFEERAARFSACGVLTPADLLVVDAVAARFGESDPDALLGLAFAVRAPRVGDVGVHLPSVRDRVDDEDVDADVAPGWPADVVQWESAVLGSPMVGSPTDVTLPFVRQDLANGRRLVMTRRLWREQERLATAALALAREAPSLTLDDEVLAAGLVRLFGSADTEGARAVATAARRRLTVVTGGPGTGKTYSIKRLLALLLERGSTPNAALRIELAAPTGKAAVRMADAIAEDLAALPVEERVRSVLSSLCPRTLHKLLGIRPDGSCRHGANRPLDADLVVVDEASMVDLALMRRLFEAIPVGARLVLLGDRDQLASVEAGTVLADFVGPVLDRPSIQGVGAKQSTRSRSARTGAGRSTLRESVVPFRTSHRFASAPTVAAIARSLQAPGNDELEQVQRWMSGSEPAADDPLRDRVTHLGAPEQGRPSEAQLDLLAAPYLAHEGVIGLLASNVRTHGTGSDALRSPALHLELLRALERYRVLAVHRRGPLGVSGLELAMAKRCQERLRLALRAQLGLPEDAPVRLPARAEHWLGRPLLVTKNSYEVGLMNGDVGLVLETARGLAAVFPARVGGLDGTREIALGRLPEHTGALAMTVHKSQGSQFERVAVVLAGRDSPIQTRELVYTAITRASSRLDWLGDREELARALDRRIGRASGLGDLLWSSAG